jgi:signal transduction histidine kinase
VVGIRHTYQQKEYLITATAYDQYGYQKLHLLFKNILIFFILSIIVIFMAGMLFSKKAFDPVREMTEKARNISATNLHLRLNIQDHQDEISELALTFNHMLQRLENAFDAQKHFVSHIAHELRTPLAAIISELELCISSEQTVEEYQRVVQNAWGDAHRLSRLFSNLLDVAKANYDPAEINFKPIRMDEVLLDASLQVQQSNPHYHLQISYDFDTDTVHDANEHLLTINGNEYLLKVAFANLMENACKFSENHTCQISISTAPLSHHQSKNILLYFKDKGIGMTDDDVSHIFQPFYRGNNKPYADGNGIGLYLTQKIVHLHQGTITVDSTPQKGTTFTVALPPSLVS